MQKNLMFIINPVAGKGGFRSGLNETLETFYNGGYIPTVYFTAGKGDATRLAKERGADYDLVVCAGGDGTLSEVVSGLVTLDTPPPLGYIPIGSTNDVATTLNLPRNPLKAAQNIISGKPVPLDVGKFGNDAYFTYIAAFGAFTDVSYETPQETKQVLGHLAYILEGMSRLKNLTHHKCTVEYDGGVIHEDLIFGAVTNSTSVAGLLRLDGSVVHLGDGMFEVILIRNPKSMLDINGIISDILAKNYQGEKFTLFHSQKVRFIFDEPVAWTRDGESGGRHKEVCLENLHTAIKILV